MPGFYFWILAALLVATLAATVSKPERIYEYPFFMAATFAVFILPQAISLIRAPGVAQPDWIAHVLLMCCLCFGACWAGYRLPINRFWQHQLSRPLDPDRLFYGGLAFVAINFYFSALIAGMTEEETGGSRWTGKVTIYDFFGTLIYPGFAICLMTALRTGRLFPWLATLVAAIHPLETSLLAGRREMTVLLLMTLALALFYQRGIKPPRAGIVFVVLVAMVFIPATGSYRALSGDRDWEGVRNIDLVDNFKRFLNQESVLELRHAAVVMEATRQSGIYYYGEGYWDQMVFRFVPAQILGKEFKDSLMFLPSDELTQNELAKLNYIMPTGSTLTGMADSFQQFGWLGCVFFAGMGLLFKNFFSASVQPNATFAQLFYIQIGTSAMRAVTHQTLDFLPGLTYYAIFLGLLSFYARVPSWRTAPAVAEEYPKAHTDTRKLHSVPGL